MASEVPAVHSAFGLFSETSKILFWSYSVTFSGLGEEIWVIQAECCQLVISLLLLWTSIFKISNYLLFMTLPYFALCLKMSCEPLGFITGNLWVRFSHTVPTNTVPLYLPAFVSPCSHLQLPTFTHVSIALHLHLPPCVCIYCPMVVSIALCVCLLFCTYVCCPVLTLLLCTCLHCICITCQTKHS